MTGADELYAMFLETSQGNKPSKKSAESKPVKSKVETSTKTVKKSQEKKQHEKVVEKMPERSFITAVKNIQKSAKSNGYAEEKSMYLQDGKLILLDGHRILRSKYDFWGAKKADSEENFFDADKFFQQVHSLHSEKMEAPEISELKRLILKAREDFCEGLSELEIKRAKRNGDLKRILYRFENGLTVNAQYLLDAINLTGVTEFYSSGLNDPMLFESQDGIYEHALLPVYNPDPANCEHKGECFVA